MEDPNIVTASHMNLNGSLTVSLHLKGTTRRYRSPDLKSTLTIDMGCPVTELEEKLDESLATLRQQVLIACGRAQVTE